MTASTPKREAESGVTGLYRAMKWLDDIKCVPLKASGILQQVARIKTSSLNLQVPLWKLQFSQSDHIQDVFMKYAHSIQGYEDPLVVRRVKATYEALFSDYTDIGDLGCKMLHLSQQEGRFEDLALNALEELQLEVLHYKFKNPKLLLAALTHRSAKHHFELSQDYEKLEALGDALLDYMININMMRYTMFERYLPQHDQPNLTDEQLDYLRTYKSTFDF